MNINEYIIYIDNKLDNLLKKLNEKDYLLLIENNPCLNTYDHLFGIYENYNNIPEYLKKIISIPLLKNIKEYLDEK